MMNNKFNGFASEEQYLKAFEILKNIQAENDTYGRDSLSVTREEAYVEFVLDNFSIRIWDEYAVGVYILDEERLVDSGIINVCHSILENLQEGAFDFMW